LLLLEISQKELYNFISNSLVMVLHAHRDSDMLGDLRVVYSQDNTSLMVSHAYKDIHLVEVL